MHRLFVALRLPEDVRDHLIDAMDESPELRWVPDDNLHLTLRFIGEVERPTANDLAAALDQIRMPRFELRVSGVGMFDRRNGGAVWAGVQPKEPVATLAAKVERACQSAGLAPEQRAFHPHITLARFNRQTRSLAQSFAERTGGLSSAPFPVTDFALIESRLSRHGAHYEEMEVFPLTKAMGAS